MTSVENILKDLKDYYYVKGSYTFPQMVSFALIKDGEEWSAGYYHAPMIQCEMCEYEQVIDEAFNIAHPARIYKYEENKGRTINNSFVVEARGNDLFEVLNAFKVIINAAKSWKQLHDTYEEAKNELEI